jgi:putative ABC transport system permease protein
MLKNYLLITVRSMMKNKLFIVINILGLATAIACCIVAYFNWELTATFDKNHVNMDKIYRISSVREFEGKSKLLGLTPAPLGEIIRQSIPDVNNVTRMSWSFSNFKVGDNLFPSYLKYVDGDFFEMFNFEFLSGNPADLKNKSKVFLSDEWALKLFNSTDVVGKPLTQVIGTRLKELQVGGVFKSQPANNSFVSTSFMNYEDYRDDIQNEVGHNWKSLNTVFVMINDPSRVNAVHQQIQLFKENNNSVREEFQIKEFVLDPFNGMAKRDEANDTPTQTRAVNPKASVVAPILMAMLILLISCFNMTNTTIAISSRRLKEIGIRKVMGSVRKEIILQFLCETFLICSIATLLGLFLGEILLNYWNIYWPDIKLDAHYLDNPSFVIFLISTLIVTVFLAGFYPAFYISKFEPINILKGKLKFGGTNPFTRTLLTLQYAISLIAVIFALSFYQNSIYQRDFDIGFNERSVIITDVENQSEYETYRNALLSHKDIISVAGSEHSIFIGGYMDPVKSESKELMVEIINVGDDYAKTMELKLLEGRDFMKDSETDRKESVIVSEKLVKSFGWSNPIGKQLTWQDTIKLYVIGVVKDVYTNGLWRENDPLMIRYTSPENYTLVIVNVPQDKVKEMDTFMEKEWKKIFPHRLYSADVIDESIAESTMINNNIVRMFSLLGIVAMILSGTGLFTMVSLNIIAKMKEIGVRKVHGASIGNIARIISKEFVIILIIASVFGSVGSYFLVDLLMSSIWKYYQTTTSTTFIISISMMFVISTITIGYKVFDAASMNPVYTLQNE